MSCHPSELQIGDILNMNRANLIGALMEFGQHSALQFNPLDLNGLSNSVLRQTLRDVRRHYQARGY